MEKKGYKIEKKKAKTSHRKKVHNVVIMGGPGYGKKTQKKAIAPILRK